VPRKKGEDPRSLRSLRHLHFANLEALCGVRAVLSATDVLVRTTPSQSESMSASDAGTATATSRVGVDLYDVLRDSFL
jgi:hypothetical protein